MTSSIIFKLISKDLKINRKAILLWFFAAVAGILIAYSISGLVAANIGFSLMGSAVIGVGIHLITHTILYDHLKGTHIFIMSLPLNFKQYTVAKLSVNILVFYGMWLLLSAACLYVSFSQAIFPMGSFPMMLMVLMSILPAYSLILSVCTLTQSIGYTVVSAVTCSFATPAYLWKVVYLDSVGAYVWGSEAVWNTTVFNIMMAQVLIAIIVPVLTVILQFRKKDFI